MAMYTIDSKLHHIDTFILLSDKVLGKVFPEKVASGAFLGIWIVYLNLRIHGSFPVPAFARSCLFRHQAELITFLHWLPIA